ncbi:MAG: hypothetical protein R3300_01010 [Candidatus Promineifilaceae bacterium]|nr:hypothetical protein [Candidatus Promineifilaceae bacterium]
MQVQRIDVDVTFLGQWLVANAIGLVVGGMLAITGFVVGEALGADEFTINSVQTATATAAGGAVFGLFLGGGPSLAQYLVLRRYLDGIDRYVPATAVAAALTLAVGLPLGFWLIPWEVNALVIALFFGLLPGMVMGLVQGRILRSEVSWAAMWAFISAIAFTAGILVVALISAEGQEIVAFGAGGLTMGLISGVYLWQQLR